MWTVNFTAKAPHQVHGTDIDVRETGSWCFAYTAFDTVVWGGLYLLAWKQNTYPWPAREQNICWARHHGDTLGLIHHLEHTVRYMSDEYQSKLDQCAMIVSTGSIDHSYDNALAQSVNGAYKTELIRERTLMSVKDLEHATMCWVTWWNTNRLHTSLGYKNPATIKPEHYTLHKTKNKLTTKKCKQKPAHIGIQLVME